MCSKGVCKAIFKINSILFYYYFFFLNLGRECLWVEIQTMLKSSSFRKFWFCPKLYFIFLSNLDFLVKINNVYDK